MARFYGDGDTTVIEHNELLRRFIIAGELLDSRRYLGSIKRVLRRIASPPAPCFAFEVR